MLEVNEQRNAHLLRQLVDPMHFRRVNGDVKLQLAETDCPSLEVSSQHIQSSRFSGIRTGEAHKSIRIVGLQGRATGVVSQLGKHPALSSLQDCGGHPVISLVGNQFLVGAPLRPVARMLVDVESRFCLR